MEINERVRITNVSQSNINNATGKVAANTVSAGINMVIVLLDEPLEDGSYAIQLPVSCVKPLES